MKQKKTCNVIITKQFIEQIFIKQTYNVKGLNLCSIPICYFFINNLLLTILLTSDEHMNTKTTHVFSNSQKKSAKGKIFLTTKCKDFFYLHIAVNIKVKISVIMKLSFY